MRPEVKTGDVFRTTCAWFNPTEEILPDPAEMCTTNLVVYPLEQSLTCIDGTYIDN